MDFLHLVNETLELLFRQLFLLDGLSGSDIGANCPIALGNLRIKISQEHFVPLNKLVIRVC